MTLLHVTLLTATDAVIDLADHIRDLDVVAVTLDHLTSPAPWLNVVLRSREDTEELAWRLHLNPARESGNGTQVHTEGQWQGVTVHLAGVLTADELAVSDPEDADRHGTDAWDQARDEEVGAR